MGHKALKDHYKIKWIVCVDDDDIVIGSAYIHDIIRIDKFGMLVKCYDAGIKELKKLIEALKRDEGSVLKSIIETPDRYDGPLLPVYTYDKGRVITRLCEAHGWPNVTTDGELMYENTFFKEYAEAKAALLKSTATNLRAGFRSTRDHIANAFSTMGKSIRYSFTDLWYYIRARLWRF